MLICLHSMVRALNQLVFKRPFTLIVLQKMVYPWPILQNSVRCSTIFLFFTQTSISVLLNSIQLLFPWSSFLSALSPGKTDTGNLCPYRFSSYVLLYNFLFELNVKSERSEYSCDLENHQCCFKFSCFVCLSISCWRAFCSTYPMKLQTIGLKREWFLRCLKRWLQFFFFLSRLTYAEWFSFNGLWLRSYHTR